MSKVNIAKLTAFKTGAVLATGLMQSSLTALAGMKEGSASLNLGEPETTDINIEESSTPFASIEGSAENDLTIEVIGAEAQALAPLIGGNYSAATGSDPEQIAMPAASTAAQRAIQLEGENSDGEPIIIAIPKGKIIRSVPGTIGKGDVRGWQLKCKILQPDDGGGNLTDWLIFKVGTPA